MGALRTFCLRWKFWPFGSGEDGGVGGVEGLDSFVSKCGGELMVGVGYN